MITITKAMETGVPKIDMQHKELISRLNTVVSMGVSSVSKEETERTLDLLEDYVIQHFKDEEELQKKSGYPKYEWHKEQHRQFVKELDKLKEEFEANGHSARFTLSLNKSIIQWIVKHIMSVDVEFGKHYQAHG